MTAGNHIKLPTSIAIVMDGNGRWAEKRGLDRCYGHEQGSKAAEDIIKYSRELGIKYITLYAFSSENWDRPEAEVNAVMSILEKYLKNDTKDLIKHGIKINAIGDLDRLPKFLKSTLDRVIKETSSCAKFVISLALSYGSWDEVSQACKNIAENVAAGIINIQDINKNLLNSYLSTYGIPHPDLFIRTSGEQRMSNFLLLQSSYTELYFTDTLWPDFQRSDLDLALASFASRTRRFGKTN